ncbi:hypothetical protein K7H13_09515 [Qipengyuania citrea]|uniref:hypothetical protein n=1 Tax=Qipengyuania citrea TaxID=225971 RepID=UPI001E2E4C69|nr:hypothetical protein [Qipengyuania citrea]MCD1590999.1 hypothetical protein [Qipengyuania citrea]|tara:strand:- start:28239 stop:28493 length:255 start_codon:yes stop_codon:yes gene_type:complete
MAGESVRPPEAREGARSWQEVVTVAPGVVATSPAKHGKASLSTTVREAAGKSGSTGGAYRSAISGRFVTAKHGKSSPSTTVREK